MTVAEQDTVFMRSALDEARKGLGWTSPNPAVGAVLVIKDKIVARGHHKAAGKPHAEIECLRRYGKAVPATATLYVTLEPCSTQGRTGACTGAIIQAGVKKLVVGAADPNPKHAGAGIDRLRREKIEVRTGVLAEECADLNEGFSKWIQTKRPFVIAKCGMSLDGRLSRRPGESGWITSPASRRHAQLLRARVDAILIGAETLRTDNPRLTVRGTGGGRQPWRVIVSRSGSLPRNARVFTDRFAERTIVSPNKNLAAVLRELGEKEITSVLIEGGGDILGQALDLCLIDKVQLYIGPIFTGGPVLAFPGRGAASTRDTARLNRVRYERIGNDICVTGYPTKSAIGIE